MMMVTDVSRARDGVGELAAQLEELGKQMGLSIRCMREDIFDSMHRI